MADNELDKKIRKLSKQKGISLKQLASKIEMSESGLIKSLKNNVLKVATLRRIADVFEVSVTDLIILEAKDFITEAHGPKIESLEKKINALIGEVIELKQLVKDTIKKQDNNEKQNSKNKP